MTRPGLRPDRQSHRPLALLKALLLVLWVTLALAATASAQTDPDEDDIFAELDEAEERGASGDYDKEEDEEEDDLTDYGFDDPDSLGFGVEEMVVTGRASDATAQATPEAITEFSQSDLDKMDISNVEALSLNTPSLHVGKFGGQPVITLRGVGAGNLTTAGTPGVGFEVDGIHQGRPTAAAVRIYDVEDVRVYKGPQGTAGGYNTNGGRIAVRSKRPQEELDLMADVQYGAYDQILLRGALNVPILPDGLLMARGTVTYENRDGYQQNLTYDVKNFNADDADDLISRFQTRSLFFDESLEFRTIGGYNYQKGIGPARKLLSSGLNAASTVGLLLPGPFDNGTLPYERERLLITGCTNLSEAYCLADDPRETYQDEIGSVDNRQANITGILNWDMPFLADSEWLSDLRLSATGGWMKTSRSSLVDVDGTNSPHTRFSSDLAANQGSIEVFIERPDVERFDFKLGAYYFREQVDSFACIDSRGSASNAADIATDQDLLNQSIAGYGTVGYRFFDNLRLSGQLRYSNERKKIDQENLRFASISGLEDPARPNNSDCSKFYQKFLNRPDHTAVIVLEKANGTGSFETAADDHWNKLTYSAAAEWDVTDFNALAISFASGFKPGGFSLGANPALGSVSEEFGPEDVFQYQLVSKNQFWDSRIQANLTFFWTDYDPFQVCQIIGVQFKCNTDGRALSRGIELEVVAMPVDGLSINGHFNFLDTKIDNFYLQDPTETLPGQASATGFGGPPRDLTGNALPKAPRFGGSFGIQYDWDLERWGIFSPRVQMQTQSRTYYRVFNVEEFSQKAFAKLDISLEWRSEDGVYLVRGFVNNVTDVDVLNFLFIGPANIGGPALGFYLPPRTWGIRVGITTLPDFF